MQHSFTDGPCALADMSYTVGAIKKQRRRQYVVQGLNWHINGSLIKRPGTPTFTKQRSTAWSVSRGTRVINKCICHVYISIICFSLYFVSLLCCIHRRLLCICVSILFVNNVASTDTTRQRSRKKEWLDGVKHDIQSQNSFHFVSSVYFTEITYPLSLAAYLVTFPQFFVCKLISTMVVRDS